MANSIDNIPQNISSLNESKNKSTYQMIELPTSPATHKQQQQQKQSQSQDQNQEQQDKTSPLSYLYWALTRKKPLDRRTETNLNRCLGLLDLTTLGELSCFFLSAHSILLSINMN